MKKFTFYVEEVRYWTIAREYPDDTTDEEALQYMRDAICYKNAWSNLTDARIDELIITDNENGN